MDDRFKFPAKKQIISPFSRRSFLWTSLAAGASAILHSQAEDAQTATAPLNAGAELVRFPEKTDLILLTDQPPQLETPLRFFKEDYTPNDAFYVRWHLANIPTAVDTQTFQLRISGHVQNPIDLSLHDLRTQFEPVTLTAVNQCSGNSRSLFQPRVPGGQWGNGAIGNARWTGVRLKDLLDRAGVKAGAVEVSFQGLDRAPLPATPAYIKALDIDHARDGEVMVAYAMNGAPLPMLNGFPMRLVVPGWFATYWIKALNEIIVLPKKFEGFWMDKAYRIPKTADAQESPEKLAEQTEPINRMAVRSLFVSPEPGQKIAVGKVCDVEGLAVDCGKGIQKVEVSIDEGKTWGEAKLDADIGKYSWRRWRYSWTPTLTGPAKIMSRATNKDGETQTINQWNRSGYRRNVVESMDVTIG